MACCQECRAFPLARSHSLTAPSPYPTHALFPANTTHLQTSVSTLHASSAHSRHRASGWAKTATTHLQTSLSTLHASLAPSRHWASGWAKTATTTHLHHLCHSQHLILASLQNIGCTGSQHTSVTLLYYLPTHLQHLCQHSNIHRLTAHISVTLLLSLGSFQECDSHMWEIRRDKILYCPVKGNLIWNISPMYYVK